MQPKIHYITFQEYACMRRTGLLAQTLIFFLLTQTSFAILLFQINAYKSFCCCARTSSIIIIIDMQEH